MTGPGWREPTLATLTDRRFSDDGWIFERKLDGVRALCVRDDGPPTLYSRNHKVMDKAYPELVEALAAQGGPRFVADGEIVAFDESGNTSFAALQPRIHVADPDRALATGVRVYYYLFDLLYFDDQDTTALPLRQRKALLRDAFDFEDPLRLSTHRNAEGEKFFDEACRRGWEGVVAKRADSPYRHGRTPEWLKFKCARGQELVIGGFTDPQGARHGFGALLLGYHEDGVLNYAGKVGTGFNEELLASLHAQLKEREVGRSPFGGPVKEPGAHWVRPDLVAQVGFSEWTRDGRLRHPRFAGLREDKKAADVVRERP
ncbi:non-homologous end-joining DNA ligase [Amycolatopsis sp. NPDC088138]|uniref:non-homologous end-joining DNA ligase n=1 Tax=Amycolatopsis sp. NPDC088138 TaxID=3363938 RepID=UPI00382905E6